MTKNSNPRFRHFLAINEFLTLHDYAFLFVGTILAIFTGAGLPYLVCVVGWLLNAFVMLYPTTEEFRAKTTPLLLYFVSGAVVLAIISFLQYVCFRIVTLKLIRRIRRKYLKLLIQQNNDYFINQENEKLNNNFETNVAKITVGYTESLPTIIVTISQVCVSLWVAYDLSWKLALPIMGLGGICAIWFFILTLILSCQNSNELNINQKTINALKESKLFRKHCSTLYCIGIKKGICTGILAGSAHLFIYLGMGLGAVYGNYLIDNDEMDLPGNIFVIACGIIPAAIKLGQIYSHINGLYGSRLVVHQIHQLEDKLKVSVLESVTTRATSRQEQQQPEERQNPTTIQGPTTVVVNNDTSSENSSSNNTATVSETINTTRNNSVNNDNDNNNDNSNDNNNDDDIDDTIEYPVDEPSSPIPVTVPAPPPQYWSTPGLKKKQFLSSFFKNEINTAPVITRPKNSSIFIKLRKSALKKRIYIIGFIFCLVFAAAPPTFTKLNGDLYEFYQIGRTEPFFHDGVSISYRYLICGVIACLTGIFGTIVYARNGEALANEIRCQVYSEFISRHGSNLSEAVRKSMIPLVVKAANQCKSAFDTRLSTFTVGVFSLAFGIAFVFEKNVPCAFVCSIIFGLQAVAQYFVFRIADIHYKRAVNEKNDKAKISLQSFEGLHESELERKIPQIAENHDQYLRFTFHKLSSCVPTQALKYSFVISVPQVSQAVAYVIGVFLVVEGVVRPIVLYKIVQTLYMSAFTIATIAQFNMDVYQARVGAIDLDNVIGEDEPLERRNSARSNSNMVV